MSDTQLLLPRNDRELEAWLQVYGVYCRKEAPATAPVAALLRRYGSRQIGQGIMSRVFRLGNTGWVVKEGRWDLKIDISPRWKLPLYARATERLLGMFSYTFLPTVREAIRQYGQYLHLREHLGYSDEYPPQEQCICCHRNMHGRQRHVRQMLAAFASQSQVVRDTGAERDMHQALASDALIHDFLPREYLLIGRSFSPENKGRFTSFVFQEFVEGKPLHDIGIGTLDERKRGQMLVLLLLILRLHEYKRLLPDTRPRYPTLQMTDWLTKTDNIFVTDGGLKFIDTRWLWETDSNLVKRGLIIPELTLQSVQNALRELSRR